MEEQKITETLVVEKIKEFLINKQNGNWHEEKSKISKHQFNLLHFLHRLYNIQPAY